MKRQQALSYFAGLRIFCVIIVYFGVLNVALGASAEQQEIGVLNKELSSASSKRAAVIKELKSLDHDIAKLSQQIHRLKQDITNNKKILEANKKEDKKLQQQQQNAEHDISSYITSLYTQGKQPYLKILFNQQDPSKTGRALVYFQYLHAAKRQQIDLYKDSRNQLQSIRAQIVTKNRFVNKMIGEQEQKFGTLKATQIKRSEVLAHLKKTIKSKRHRINFLKKNQKKLNEIARQSRKENDVSNANRNGTSFAKSKGKLNLPVKGKIIARYGKSRLTSQVKWKGLLIQAAQGTAVKSVALGSVVFADWLQGYGFVLIIDHGSTYMSLYAHNQSLLKSLGDKVKKNEVIALVGNSGSLEKSALYFEIRHKGQPVNPSKWLIARR